MDIQVSNGEIVDKITILKIKTERITDKVKLDNSKSELDYLSEKATELIGQLDTGLFESLYSVNLKLWEIEDAIREKEKNKYFDEKFIDLARSVYIINDERAKLKKQINILTQSTFIEEKSYESY